MDNQELKVLFPARVVTLSDGETKVTVTPLSLENLPKVADSFGELMKYAEGGATGAAEIAAKALKEVLQLVPYCIDMEPKYIPASEVPDILEIVVEQNITEAIVGKWMGLVQKVIEASGRKDLIETVKKTTTSPE
jgi:fumarylacetoacetate (FAA) hydrolase family protein